MSGRYVAGVSRSSIPNPCMESEHVLADRSDPQAILDIVREKRIDVVVDLLAYTESATRPLLASLEGRIGRFVLVSSCDVYRDYGLLHRREAGLPQLGDIDEKAPLRASRYPYRASTPRPTNDPTQWMDNYDKIPIEEATKLLRSDWTILRLPMVFGPGDRQRRFRWAIEPMLAGVDTIEVPPQWADWLTTYGYVENVGAAIALASGHERASRSTFNVGDSESVNHREWIKRFCRATGWQGTVRDTDSSEHPIAKAIERLDMSVPLRISSAKLFQELSFKPPVDVHASAKLTVADETKRR